VWRRPPASPLSSARAIASRREKSTISAIAGIRIETSRSAISGGDRNSCGWSPPTSTVTLTAIITTRIVAMTAVTTL
jgi:hypothetical protein